MLREEIGCRTAVAEAQISEPAARIAQFAKRLAVMAVTMTEHSDALCG
jgi:hypothetical protein